MTLQLRFSLKKPLMLNFKPVFSFSSELLYNPAQFLSVWEWLQEMQVKSFSMRGQNAALRHTGTAPLHFNGGSAKRLNCNGSGESRCVEGHCGTSFVICSLQHISLCVQHGKVTLRSPTSQNKSPEKLLVLCWSFSGWNRVLRGLSKLKKVKEDHLNTTIMHLLQSTI